MNKILRPLLAGFLLLQSCSQVSDHFTIIGNTTGFKDSTKLFLQDSKASSLLDNLDSTYVINNSFTFRGSVSEVKTIMIHTGYTGWNGQPPESFLYVAFFIDNETIHMKDDIGNLKYSTFTGSELQNDNTDCIKTLKMFLIKNDSINKVVEKLTLYDSSKARILGKESTENYEAMNEAISVFITTHPKSIVSIANLTALKNVYGKEKTKFLFDQLDQRVKSTKYAQEITDYLNFKESDEVVDISNIELPDINGGLVRLSSLKGKYVLLEFWASWCAPCRADNPELLKIYNKYKGKGFEIYAISLDENKDNWMDAVAKDSINWITVSDLKGPSDNKIAMAFEVTGIPKNFLLDKEGKIIDQDLRGDKLAARLDEIFKDK